MSELSEAQQSGSPDPGSEAAMQDSTTVEGHWFDFRWEGAAVLRCHGELDTLSQTALRDALDGVPQSIPVVVDLGEVRFLDCGAIGELVRARNSRRAEGADLHVREPSALARRVLSIVELDDMVLPVDVSDEVHRPATAGANDVVDAWAASVSDMADPDGLVFSDPSLLVSALLGTDDQDQRPAPSAPVPVSIPRSDGSTVSSAVLQLLVLDDVLRCAPVDADASNLGRGGARRSPEERHAVVTDLVGGLLAELEAVSLVDPLTGLLNRRALDRDLPDAIASARRHRQGLVVVMVDVDGLKSINDGQGHAAGDGALRGVARSLRGGCRPEDGAYRIGGDEFVLVLHAIGIGDVAGVIDRIRLRRPPAFTWGCADMEAELGDEDRAIADVARAARLLELADDRMLRHRLDARGDRFDGADSPSTMDLSDDLRRTSRDSIVIEQAGGFIAERLGVDVDVSLDILWSMARQRGEPVASTAAGLVAGTVDLTASPPAPARVGEHPPDSVDRVSGSTPGGG